VWKKIATLAKPASTKLMSKSKATSLFGRADQPNKSVSDEAVRLRAYQKWEAAGTPEGEGVQFWSEAEREILKGT
jgi:hypothetical protein